MKFESKWNAKAQYGRRNDIVNRSQKSIKTV